MCAKSRQEYTGPFVSTRPTYILINMSGADRPLSQYLEQTWIWVSSKRSDGPGLFNK